MSTAKGITGGAYKLTTTVIIDLSEKGISKNTLKTIGSENYSISVDNLNSIRDKNINLALISEIEQEHLGKIFNSRRNFERFLKICDEHLDFCVKVCYECRPGTVDWKRLWRRIR